MMEDWRLGVPEREVKGRRSEVKKIRAKKNQMLTFGAKTVKLFFSCKGFFHLEPTPKALKESRGHQNINGTRVPSAFCPSRRS